MSPIMDLRELNKCWAGCDGCGKCSPVVSSDPEVHVSCDCATHATDPVPVEEQAPCDDPACVHSPSDIGGEG